MLLCIHGGYSFIPLFVINYLGNSTGSRTAVKEAVLHVFAWIHQAAEFSSPNNDPFVKAVLHGRSLLHTGTAHCKEETIY